MKSIMADRSLPHDTEAEQALLSAILVHNAAYDRVSRFLRPRHFAIRVHRHIFAAIGQLIEHGRLANPVTLTNFFDRRDALHEIDGGDYLIRLAGAAGSLINAEDYGNTIYDLYLRRQLITLAKEMVSDAYAQDLEHSAVDLIEAAKQRLLDLANGAARERPQSAIVASICP